MNQDQHGNETSPPTAPSQPVYMVYAPDTADDSIHLEHLIGTLWTRKWLIVGVTAAFVAVGVAYALLTTPIYRAEAVLAPNLSESSMGQSSLGGLADLAGVNLGRSSDATHVIATLRSRAFVEGFIEDNDLLPVLFADRWDVEDQAWLTDGSQGQPDIRDGVRYFINNVRSVSEDAETGLVTLGVEWSDPEIAAQWAEALVARINERVRARDLEDSQRRLEYLNGQLEKAGLVELRQAISSLIEDQVERIMLAQAEAEYAFRVIDPPRVPNERAWPRRRLIVVVAGLMGGMIGCVMALFWRLPDKSRTATQGDETS